MNWTRINYSTVVAMKGEFESYYNSTTLMKERYSFTKSPVSFASSLGTIGWHDSSYYITESVIGSPFSAARGSVDMCEFAGTDTEIYGVRDVSNPASYLTNVFFITDNNTLMCLHSGTTTGSVDKCTVNTDKSATAIDILNLISVLQTANNNFGNDYIVQPLYLYDEKTPLFTISGNTELAPFSVIQVQTRKFMVIGKGICVEIE